MTYLLDTNTCIRYLNGRAPRVLQRLQALPPTEIQVCAVAHNLTLVTHNTAEFSRVPDLHFEDWE